MWTKSLKYVGESEKSKEDHIRSGLISGTIESGSHIGHPRKSSQFFIFVVGGGTPPCFLRAQTHTHTSELAKKKDLLWFLESGGTNGILINMWYKLCKSRVTAKMHHCVGFWPLEFMGIDPTKFYCTCTTPIITSFRIELCFLILENNFKRDMVIIILISIFL